ncbi:MAG: TRAP transporter large permease, partial [Opitutae bacterium]|nr:TRAP transporter large permease [Opitutae bacterium]
ALGAIAIPAMVRQGYPAAFSAALVAAGGAVGVIIPPSVPMVIFGFLTNESIARLFAGGMMVGLLFGLSFMAVAVWTSWRRGYGTRTPFSFRRLWTASKEAAFALGAPVIVLGGILSGVVTVTEAAALAVFYALLVSMAVNRKIKWADIPDLIVRSQIVAATILFIIAMAKVFTWLVAMQQTTQLVQSIITSLALPPWGLLLLVMAGLLVLGCIMETTAALILLVPVLAILAPRMGVDSVQFGVLMVVNLAVGMLTPPVGICLFVSCGISGLPLGQVSRAALPFVLVAFLALLVSCFWPPLTLWLPSIIYR